MYVHTYKNDTIHRYNIYFYSYTYFYTYTYLYIYIFFLVHIYIYIYLFISLHIYIYIFIQNVYIYDMPLKFDTFELVVHSKYEEYTSWLINLPFLVNQIILSFRQFWIHTGPPQFDVIGLTAMVCALSASAERKWEKDAEFEMWFSKCQRLI